jgi:hypothetical protein
MSTMFTRTVFLFSLALASPATAAPHAAPDTPTVITPGVSDASYVPLAGAPDAGAPDAPAKNSPSTCTRKRCCVFTCAAAAATGAVVMVAGTAAGGVHSVVPAPVSRNGIGGINGSRSGALANITVVGGKEFRPLGEVDYVGAEKPITLASLMEDLKTNPDTKIDCDTLPAGTDQAIQTSCQQAIAKAAEYVAARDAGDASSRAGFLAAQPQAGDQAGASAAAAQVPSLLAGVFQPYSTDIPCDEAGGDFGNDCFFACPQTCVHTKYGDICTRTCAGPLPDYCDGKIFCFWIWISCFFCFSWL